MKKRFLALSALAGLAVISAPAMADPITGIISISGTDSYTPTTITFAPGSTVGGVSQGTLSVFTAGNPVTMNSFNIDGGFVPGTVVFTTTESGITSSLTLQTLTSTINVSSGLVINAMGMLTETGFASTPGTFTLTSQDGGTGAKVTFSATAIAATPEPSGIALLGTGLLCAAGLVRRRLNT